MHPWFGGVPVEQAAGWTWEFFEENDVAISEAVSNKPVPYVAEVRARCSLLCLVALPGSGASLGQESLACCLHVQTGWPTASMTPENATLGGAVAGVSELQTFLDTYPCQANANESCESSLSSVLAAPLS